MREHSNTSSRALKHEHDTSAARTRSREHSSITSNRALEYSSTRARARRALEHQRSGTTNTRALEHSPTLEYSNTGTSTRTLGHAHEHSNMSTRGGRTSSARRQHNSDKHVHPVGRSFHLYVGLHAPGWLYVLGMPPRTDVPLLTPRARATDLGQGPNLRMGSGRASCVPRSREHEERSAAGRAKNAEG